MYKHSRVLLLITQPKLTNPNIIYILTQIPNYFNNYSYIRNIQNGTCYTITDIISRRCPYNSKLGLCSFEPEKYRSERG